MLCKRGRTFEVTFNPSLSSSSNFLAQILVPPLPVPEVELSAPYIVSKVSSVV